MDAGRVVAPQFPLRLRAYNQEARQDRGYSFFIWNLK